MASTGKPTMVLVEDSPIWRELITDTFKKEFQVKAFPTGEAFLEYWQGGSVSPLPDVAVLDFELHEAGGQLVGLDVLKAIKKTHPELPVVMNSGQRNPQNVVDTFHYGAFDYVVKGDMENDPQQLRLRLVLRNIQKQAALRQELVELRVSVKKWQLALFGFIAAILLISSFIYLNSCPARRSLQWDPFNKAATAECGYVAPTAPAPAEPAPAAAPAPAQ